MCRILAHSRKKVKKLGSTGFCLDGDTEWIGREPGSSWLLIGSDLEVHAATRQR